MNQNILIKQAHILEGIRGKKSVGSSQEVHVSNGDFLLQDIIFPLNTMFLIELFLLWNQVKRDNAHVWLYHPRYFDSE